MFETTGDYLARKAKDLDLGRGDELKAIQAQLEKLYPGQVRAVSFNGGTLRIVTPNASVASDLRLRQVELLSRFQSTSPITRLAINIGQI